MTEFGVEDVDVFEEFGFNYLYSDFNYNPLGGGCFFDGDRSFVEL